MSATTTPAGTRPTSLYRYFDAEGRLLYVGITARRTRRGHEHERDKDWWGDVASSTIEHFPTRAEASEAEGLAISSENPLHNLNRRRVTLPKPPPPERLHWRPVDRPPLVDWSDERPDAPRMSMAEWEPQAEAIEHVRGVEWRAIAAVRAREWDIDVE